MKKNNYENVLNFIYKASPNRLSGKSTSDYSLDRIRELLDLLGNPQNSFKSIHIAGTSGKGSTAVILSNILRSQGFKVGLTLSPHILDIRERLQINNRLFNKEPFAKNFNEILPFIKKVNKKSRFSLSFFEMMVALAYYTFAKEKVDYAVIETGLGGTLDATNTISRPDKLCIITKIGLDHTKILGSKITEIAKQKAGIIHEFNSAITCDQTDSVIRIFNKQCAITGENLLQIKMGINFLKTGNSLFNFKYGNLDLKNIKLGMNGDFQIENASLALAALQLLSTRDKFPINRIFLLNTLKNVKNIGRFEIFNFRGRKIIVDGAHNPQKMKAFISSLISLYPDKFFNFYIAFKEDKDYVEMLKLIIPHALNIFVSDFIVKNIDTRAISIPAEEVKKAIEKTGFKNVKIIKNNEVFSSIMEGKTDVVITGSLYFISQLYLNNTFFRNR